MSGPYMMAALDPFLAVHSRTAQSLFETSVRENINNIQNYGLNMQNIQYVEYEEYDKYDKYDKYENCVWNMDPPCFNMEPPVLI